MTTYTKEENGKVRDIVELLLQCIELIPAAAKHVGQYVTHAEVHEFQEVVKAKGEEPKEDTRPEGVRLFEKYNDMALSERKKHVLAMFNACESHKECASLLLSVAEHLFDVEVDECEEAGKIVMKAAGIVGAAE